MSHQPPSTLRPRPLQRRLWVDVELAFGLQKASAVEAVWFQSVRVSFAASFCAFGEVCFTHISCQHVPTIPMALNIASVKRLDMKIHKWGRYVLQSSPKRGSLRRIIGMISILDWYVSCAIQSSGRSVCYQHCRQLPTLVWIAWILRRIKSSTIR